MQKQFLLLCLSFNLLLTAFSQKQVVLPNGWKLSPAGKSLPLGDLPLNIAVSNSKKCWQLPKMDKVNRVFN